MTLPLIGLVGLACVWILARHLFASAANGFIHFTSEAFTTSGFGVNALLLSVIVFVLTSVHVVRLVFGRQPYGICCTRSLLVYVESW